MTFAILLSLSNLLLYCIQQLGVTLGVGAETTLLVAYLHTMRDGVADDQEKGFARAVRHVKDLGLFLIIASGIGILVVQFFNGQLNQFFTTVVFVKWSLIGIVLFMSFIVRGYTIIAGLLQGLSAGTWYALFAIHILAPTASWLQLGIFYALWLAGFTLCWSVLVFALRGKPGSAPRAAPAAAKPVQKAPEVKHMQSSVTASPQPRSVYASVPAPATSVVMPSATQAKQPQVIQKNPPQAAPVKPAPTPPPPTIKPAINLPVAAAPISPIWLHVMPKSPEELAKRKEA
jgi:hypothetical protein